MFLTKTAQTVVNDSAHYKVTKRGLVRVQELFAVDLEGKTKDRINAESPPLATFRATWIKSKSDVSNGNNSLGGNGYLLLEKETTSNTYRYRYRWIDELLWCNAFTYG